MLKSYIHKFNALFISFVTVQGKTYPLSNKTDRMAGKGHFHALQNQEKRSIRAPETHKNPQECAYLQPIFQKYAKRHARKNRISCGKRGSACRKDEKCLPQGRKTPAAKCPQALRNGIFRNITGHISSIRPPFRRVSHSDKTTRKQHFSRHAPARRPHGLPAGAAGCPPKPPNA